MITASADALTINQSGTDHASGALTFGAAGGTNGLDVIFQAIGAGDELTFNAAGSLFTYDGVDIKLGHDDLIFFGDGSEITFQFNTAQTALVVGMTNDEWNFGADGSGGDLFWYSETVGNWIYFDEDNESIDVVDLEFNIDDDATLQIGTGNDMTFDSDGSNVIVAGNYDLTTTAVGIDITTNTSKTHKYATGGIAYVSATAISTTGWVQAEGLAQTGHTAGVVESFATEGYTEVDDAADLLLFTMPIPPLFVANGAAGDLVLELDINEQAAEECNIDVRIFEYGNTTPKVVDTILIADGAGRGWSVLITLSSGIGALFDADDILLIEVTCTADTDDFFIYGARLKYNVGIEATQ